MALRHAEARHLCLSASNPRRDDVRLWRDALRHDPPRPRPHIHRLRRARAPPGGAGAEPAVRAKHHRHRRVDPAARRAGQGQLAGAGAPRGARFSAGHEEPRLAQARRAPPCHERDPRDDRTRAAPAPPRVRLRDARRSLFRRREVPALRPALAFLESEDEADPCVAGRRAARRSEPAFTRRLRAVAPPQRRPDVAKPVRPRPPRVAPRVFGDVRPASWISDRHSRRRKRPHLSASRIRDRAKRGSPWLAEAVRRSLGARRADAPRRKEDVEVGRQHGLRARRAEEDDPAGAPSVLARCSLPAAVRPRRGTPRSRSTTRGGAR